MESKKIVMLQTEGKELWMKSSRATKISGDIVPWTVTDMLCHSDLDGDAELEIRLVKWELSILLQAADEVEKSRGEELEINHLRWQLEVLLDAIGEMGARKAVIWLSDRPDEGKGQEPEDAEFMDKEEWVNKENDMRIEDCLFFEAFENSQLRQTIGYCLTLGVKAGCQADRRFCERLETIEKSMIRPIDTNHQSGEEA